MDCFSVLNYQGSKKNLMDFIHSNLQPYISPDSTILDIFAGTCSVGYSYKKQHTIYANDSEYYAYIISYALLSNYSSVDVDTINKKLKIEFDKNIKRQSPIYTQLLYNEKMALSESIESLIHFYDNLPTIWNDNSLTICKHNCYELFTTYYSASYFGLQQCIEIDSLRFAFEQYKGNSIYYALLASLFFAMKECVFSKDGHMAQPLDLEKNSNKLIKQRSKSIVYYFKLKLDDFLSSDFITSPFNNKVFNLNFVDLIQRPEIINDVQFIYADPPYTDMQYSRYYHLLNVVAKYDYPKPTIIGGNYTKGLYTEGRYQSKLSSKSTCLSSFRTLIDFSKEYNKNLAISFAYPQNVLTQKIDRYVMTIDDIISSCSNVFGISNVDIVTKDYTHSNNRNSEAKKVLEYLILCKGNK